MRLANCVDEVLEHCEVCRSFDKAPHVSMINGKLQADVPYLDDLIALHAMDVYRQYSLLNPARSKNPQEAWGASRRAWVGVLRQPKSLQGGRGGDWQNEIRTDLCPGRSTSPNFQVRVSTTGFLSVVTGLRALRLFAWWRIVAFRERSSSLEFNGA